MQHCREYLTVGPLGLEGAVEALDLAVGQRAMRFDEALLRSKGRHGLMAGVGFSVGEGVVGEDAFNLRDATAGEERGRAEEDTGGGDTLFVRVKFGVGEAGTVVINDGVYVVVADRNVAGSVVGAGLAGLSSPASAIGDASELLDVGMHHLARASAFIPDRRGAGGANLFTGQRIAFPESRNVVARQHSRHGSSGNARVD